ncbi:caspase family protein, partial [Myxococcota bacterium]|nr:caspase family protein [Myxococcota bacterium]
MSVAAGLAMFAPSAVSAAGGQPAPTTWPALEAEAAPVVGGGGADAAVIVGVEAYDNLPPVRGAIANANAWYTWLAKARQVPARNLRLLRNKEATLEDMRAALADAGNAVGAGGTLWVVFIGHGTPVSAGDARRRDGGLVGVDAQAREISLTSRSLGRGELMRTVGEAAAARRARPVVILDACFSGRTASGDALAKDLQPVLNMALAAPTTAVELAAAKADQAAGPLPKAGTMVRPAFSYLVLGGLRGWADGALGAPDGAVSAQEAVAYARDALQTLLAGNRTQVPDLSGPGLDGGLGGAPFVLAKSGGERGPDLIAMNLGTGSGAAPGTGEGSSGGGFDAAIRAALEKQAAADAARAEAERVAAEAA